MLPPSLNIFYFFEKKRQITSLTFRLFPFFVVKMSEDDSKVVKKRYTCKTVRFNFIESPCHYSLFFKVRIAYLEEMINRNSWGKGPVPVESPSVESILAYVTSRCMLLAKAGEHRAIFSFADFDIDKHALLCLLKNDGFDCGMASPCTCESYCEGCERKEFFVDWS